MILKVAKLFTNVVKKLGNLADYVLPPVQQITTTLNLFRSKYQHIYN